MAMAWAALRSPPVIPVMNEKAPGNGCWRAPGNGCWRAQGLPGQGPAPAGVCLCGPWLTLSGIQKDFPLHVKACVHFVGENDQLSGLWVLEKEPIGMRACWLQAAVHRGLALGDLTFFKPPFIMLAWGALGNADIAKQIKIKHRRSTELEWLPWITRRPSCIRGSFPLLLKPPHRELWASLFQGVTWASTHILNILM